MHAGFDAIAPHLIVGRLLASRGPAFAAARRAVEQLAATINAKAAERAE